MTTPLGQSNTPSLFGLHVTNQSQTFCTLFPTPKGIARCAYTINPPTIAFATATDISDIEKFARPSLKPSDARPPPVVTKQTSSCIQTIDN
jgi:hypothetical protein